MPAATEVAGAPSETKPAAPKRALKVGMPAAEVQALIGKPAEITPMAGQEASAEIWIYRRLKDTKTEHVHMGDKPITENFTDAGGRVLVNVVASEAIMKLRRTDTFDVLQVLMVNGQYVNMKRTVEKKEAYE